MMRKTYFIIAILVAASMSAFAQASKEQTKKVTEDELVRYATAIDSINEMSAEVRLKLAEIVKENPDISASRYNELSKIANDDEKLAAANATPREIEVVKHVADVKAEETAKINETYQALAKEYVTAPVFNKVKKALAEEPEVKAKYDSLIVELGKDNPHDKK
jgi:hypothetical protein